MEEDSACFLGLPKELLDGSHVMMNKFCGPEDPNFERVGGKIRRMVQESRTITVVVLLLNMNLLEPILTVDDPLKLRSC